MSEQGHYKVTVHRGRGWDQPLHRTFPFGQWAEIGFWLDEIGAGERDSVAITFHPLVERTERSWQQDEHSGRWYVVDAHGVRLHGPYLEPNDRPDLASMPLPAAELAARRSPGEDYLEQARHQDELLHGLGEIDGGGE